MNSLARSVTAFAVSALLAACGETSPEPFGPGGVDETSLEVVVAPTFTADIQPMIERYGCASSSCHGVGQGNLILSSDAEANYRALVNVPANNEGQFLRVKPGDAQNSYVVMVIENRQSPIYPRMPSDDGINPIDLVNLRNWIDQGATLN